MAATYKKEPVGISLVLTAALIWGWNGPAMKGLSASGVALPTLLFLRTLVCVLISGLFFLLFHRSVFRLSFRQFLFLFFYGTFVVSGTTVGFFYSLKYMPVASALLLHYSYPVFTMLGSFLILKEKPTLRQAFSGLLILFAVGGGVFSSGTTFYSISMKGILWGLVAAVGISLQTLMARLASLDLFIPQLTLLFHGFLWSLIPITFFQMEGEDWLNIAAIPFDKWLLVVALGFVGTFLAHLLYFLGLRKISAPLGSLVSSFELVAAMFFSTVLLNECPSMSEIIGSVVVVFAIALASGTSFFKQTFNA